MASIEKKMIYMTTNNINGKIYIGQTSSHRKSYYGSGKLIKNALKEFGKKNFTRIILVNNIDSLYELNRLEKHYIKLFDSTNMNKGYNISLGGSNYSFRHSKISIEKISKRSQQLDNIIRFKEVRKLGALSRTGTNHTIETKLKIVNTKFGKIKPIFMYNKNGILLNTFYLSTDAAKQTGIKRAAIANNLSGLSKSSGGSIFTYKQLY